jgi:hypothetical protein
MIAPDMKSLRMAGWLFVLLAMSYPGKSQHVDSREIEPLINEWNFANNSRSVDGFANVYHKKLLFYTQTVSRSAAIAFKQNLFKRQPGFEQRIVSPITYTPYTSGVIKCDFTKEVFEDSTRRLYAGYLLVSYENNRYWIVGESDYKTDKTLNYKLDLGQPIQFQKQRDNEQQQPDSFSVADLSNRTEDLGNVKATSDSPKKINNADASLVQNNKPDKNNKRSLSSALITSETTAIPKRYVFMLIGLMAIGGIMIFIADTIRSRKLPAQKSLAKASMRRDRVAELKDKAAFEQFVISLFDPLYFRYRRAKPNVVLAGKGLEREPMADFEFDFRNKEKQARFAVHCIYHREVQPEMLLSADTGKRIEFSEDQNLYFILGAGGRPDDPKELFLLPAKVVSSQIISLKELQPYRKHGMFFYNSSTQSLQ